MTVLDLVPRSPSKVRISVNQTLAPTGELRLQANPKVQGCRVPLKGLKVTVRMIMIL